MKLKDKVSWLMGRVQKSLFSHLDECFNTQLTEQEQRLVLILEIIQVRILESEHLGIIIDLRIHAEFIIGIGDQLNSMLFITVFDLLLDLVNVPGSFLV